MPINKPDDRLDFHFSNAIPFAFRQNETRADYIANISQEYLLVLATLYGPNIEQGTQQLKEFDNLSMTDLELELEFRTRMVARQVLAKEERLRQEHKENEEAFMEELKKASA
jgi:hypothetical protein